MTAKRSIAGGAAGPARTALAVRQKARLPGGKTPPNWPWWWVTFGEQSRVISPECHSWLRSWGTAGEKNAPR